MTGVKKALRWLLAFAVIAAALALLRWTIDHAGTPQQRAASQKLTIAMPVHVGVSAVYVAQEQKIFEKYGLETTVQPFIVGRDALQSVLQGKADLAIVADTPFMLNVLGGEKIAAVAAIFGSRRTMAVIARTDRGIKKAEDLAGKTIATISGTNAQFFVDTLLAAHAVPRGAAKIVYYQPGTLTDALRKGEVDAITVWHPELARLEQELGVRAVTIYDEDIFVYRFLLVGRRDYIASHADQVRMALAALDAASAYIRSQPGRAKQTVGKALGMDAALLSKTFNPHDFYLALDQTMLLALSDETRWAMKNGMAPPGPIPNYLDYILQEPLAAVVPGAIKIIQ